MRCYNCPLSYLITYYNRFVVPHSSTSALLVNWSRHFVARILSRKQCVGSLKLNSTQLNSTQLNDTILYRKRDGFWFINPRGTSRQASSAATAGDHRTHRRQHRLQTIQLQRQCRQLTATRHDRRGMILLSSLYIYISSLSLSLLYPFCFSF